MRRKNIAKIGIWLMFLMLALAAMPAKTLAQEDGIQAPPTYIVGDKWVYDGGFDSLEDAKAGKNSRWKEDQMATRIVREVNQKNSLMLCIGVS